MFGAFAARTRSCAHESCNLSQCSELTSKGNLKSAQKQIYNTCGTWDDYNHQLNNTLNTFAKSCSVEDIPQNSGKTNPSGGHKTKPAQLLGQQRVFNNLQASTSCRPILQHPNSTSSGLINGTNQSIPDIREDVNLHQKLRRQLSLNPAGCDPRIYAMQRQQQQLQQQHHQSKLQVPKSDSIASDQGHRHLELSLSSPRPRLAKNWDLHQVRKRTETCKKNNEKL